MASVTSLRKLLFYSIQAAEYGGKQVKFVAESGILGTTFKGKNIDPVTIGDVRAHQVMVGIFLKQKFDVRIISEEDNPEAPIEPVDPAEIASVPAELPESFLKLVESDVYVASTDITVWIDPLDATQEYTEKLYQYVQVMVGIAVKGVPVAGVLHRPFIKDGPATLWAWSGHVICPELQSYTGPRPFLEPLRVIMSRTASHAGNVQGFADVALQGKKYELIPAGGAGYKILQVILGEADAYLHITKIKKWDLCAGHAIVQALGGNITMLEGEGINYSPPSADNAKEDVLVGNGLICAVWEHEWFVDGCRKARAVFPKK